MLFESLAFNPSVDKLSKFLDCPYLVEGQWLSITHSFGSVGWNGYSQ